MTSPARAPSAAFSERDFYLHEFRGRTLAVACPEAALRDPRPLRRVLRTLGRNRTRVIVLSTRRRPLEDLLEGRLLATARPRLEAAAWRALRAAPRLGVVVGGSRPFAPACREIVLRLGIRKLVWIDRGGGLVDARGRRVSFVDREELERLLARRRGRRGRRTALLREVEALLAAGIAAVNVCTMEGLEEELFTYAGSGTLFTRERYVAVRRLGLDDFDAAADLVARGAAEGFLAARSPRDVDRVLASGFGAFVEGRHLAGIGALVVHPKRGTGEIASLYTVTRFHREGIGAQLVGFALVQARELGLSRVFACTTVERAARFFERQGFEPVTTGVLPPEKWRGYDPARRRRLRCYARRVAPA